MRPAAHLLPGSAGALGLPADELPDRVALAALRLRTNAAKPVENSTAVLWKMLLVAQGRFWRLTAPKLLTEVYHGATFVNGVRIMERTREVAA